MTTLGDYTLHAIETGRFGLDGGAMFGIVPKPLWAKRIAPDDQNRVSLAMRCLLLQSDTHTVLIDCGLGDIFDGTKYLDIYAVDTEHSSLNRSLEAVGVSRADITDVILTHLHFDHCGGATQAGENGRETAFPNATYHVQQDHWDWAMQKNPKEAGSFRTHTFAPIDEGGQLQLVDGEREILPGMDALLVNGHTHSQQMVKITGSDQTLVFTADLLPTQHHLADAWTMAYDIRPLISIDEKNMFLERAVDAEWNLFFEHDPDAEIASLTRTDRGVQVADVRFLDQL